MFNWIFTDKEKELIFSLLAKGKQEEKINEKFTIIDFESFYKLFSNPEIDIMKKYLAIDPKIINHKLPFLGFEETPNDIITIANQVDNYNNEKHIVPCQFIPKETYNAYLQLNEKMQKEINKQLLVKYGYRSPARQVFLFFDILQRLYDYDFQKTVKRVCFPAYSEHVCVKRQAIDFMTDTGIVNDFDKTDEYKWLQKNAKRFGFFESYPKDNALGMMYEPWHWRHELTAVLR